MHAVWLLVVVLTGAILCSPLTADLLLKRLPRTQMWIESDNAYNALMHGSALWGKAL
jgi:hypothetical protein